MLIAFDLVFAAHIEKMEAPKSEIDRSNWLDLPPLSSGQFAAGMGDGSGTEFRYNLDQCNFKQMHVQGTELPQADLINSFRYGLFQWYFGQEYPDGFGFPDMKPPNYSLFYNFNYTGLASFYSEAVTVYYWSVLNKAQEFNLLDNINQAAVNSLEKEYNAEWDRLHTPPDKYQWVNKKPNQNSVEIPMYSEMKQSIKIIENIFWQWRNQLGKNRALLSVGAAYQRIKVLLEKLPEGTDDYLKYEIVANHLQTLIFHWIKGAANFVKEQRMGNTPPEEIGALLERYSPDYLTQKPWQILLKASQEGGIYSKPLDVLVDFNTLDPTKFKIFMANDPVQAFINS